MATDRTEIWARNPDNYIRECVEAGMTDVIFDYGILKRKGIDPHKFLQLHYGTVTPWRCLLIGEQGATEIDNDHDERNPVGLYPVWEYGQSWNLLEKFVQNPMDPEQEHRVFIVRPPTASTGLGRRFFIMLREIQEEYTECKLHVHGLYSYKFMFGLGFRSIDFDPRTTASKGKVYLPTGKEVSYEMACLEPHWITVLGMRPVELKIPRNRCIFNIKSARWAAEHFLEAVKFQQKGFAHVDPDDPTKRTPTNNSIFVKRKRPQGGDKWVCDLCNLQTVCKFYRQGAVCIVPESEPLELARFFKTRDSNTIIDGLGSLLAAYTARLNRALQVETDTYDEDGKGKVDPEVTKIMNSIFDRGVKLAKLVDPKLAGAGAAKIGVNVTQISGTTPQALMASVMDQFSQLGIPAEDVTPEMVMAVLTDSEGMKRRAIDVAHEERSA